MEINIYDCKHCNSKGVIPMDGFICPNCKKSLDSGVSLLPLSGNKTNFQIKEKPHFFNLKKYAIVGFILFCSIGAVCWYLCSKQISYEYQGFRLGMPYTTSGGVIMEGNNGKKYIVKFLDVNSPPTPWSNLRVLVADGVVRSIATATDSYKKLTSDQVHTIQEELSNKYGDHYHSFEFDKEGIWIEVRTWGKVKFKNPIDMITWKPVIKGRAVILRIQKEKSGFDVKMVFSDDGWFM